MAVRPENRGAELTESGLQALARAGPAVGDARNLSEALQILAEATGFATGAEIVIMRVADEASLVTCAVVTDSAAVAAELEGSRLALEDVPEFEESALERLPEGVRRAAERVHAGAAVLIPVHLDGHVQGSVELMRAEAPFAEHELRFARIAAGQAGLVIRAFARPAGEADSEAVLGLAGEALAAGGDELRTAEQVTRLATDATAALAGLLWRRGPEAELELIASVGALAGAEPLVAAKAAADRALMGRQAVSVESVSGLPGTATLSATLQLGQPPLGALQLLFARDTKAGDVDLATLATFGVRAAHALRASMHARSVELELGRTRALLGVVGQAISQLSLAHTLETAVARVGELLEADRLAVYLRDEDRLYAAAGLGLAGPHARLAERLLDLTLGPFRSRGMLVVHDVSADQRLSGVADAAPPASRGIKFGGAWEAGPPRQGSRPRSQCRCSRETRSSGCLVCSHPPVA